MSINSKKLGSSSEIYFSAKVDVSDEGQEKFPKLKFNSTANKPKRTGLCGFLGQLTSCLPSRSK